MVEHHWEFRYTSRTTASDRNKGFGTGTEPHAVVGAGAEVSIWPFPLCLTLSLRSSGPAAGRESKTDRGSHQRPPGTQVSLCLQAQSHRDGQRGWRSCWCVCGDHTLPWHGSCRRRRRISSRGRRCWGLAALCADIGAHAW